MCDQCKKPRVFKKRKDTMQSRINCSRSTRIMKNKGCRALVYNVIYHGRTVNKLSMPDIQDVLKFNKLPSSTRTIQKVIQNVGNKFKKMKNKSNIWNFQKVKLNIRARLTNLWNRYILHTGFNDITEALESIELGIKPP